MKKTTLIIISGFISSFLYGISTESISNNFVEYKETLKLSDFKHVQDHKGNNPKQKKAIYRSKESNRLWMVDQNFDHMSFRQYVIGDLFRLALGDRAPELRLIKNSEGKLMLGSEFIPKFKSLIDFFDVYGNRENAKTLKECFPTGCESEKFGGSLRINGAEDVMALMIILGELDGNVANLGLIPSQEDPELYEVGKVDHDDVACGIVNPITLRSLAKIVFGEGKSYLTDFDYEKFDLNKIADAFDAIANVPDDIWGGTIVKRGKELAKENVSEEIRGYVNMAKAIADLFNNRKNRCKDFAIGLRCEAAVRSNDFNAIEHLIEQGFDINTPVEYIHLDTSQEKQVASLVKLWSTVVQGDSKSNEYFRQYTKQNGPITILEMAVRYNKFELVKQLTSLSNTNSIMEATRAAIEIENQEIANYLAEIIAPHLMNTKTRSDL